jgi:aspartate-semialdehyde dehydrogenase
MSGLRIAVVGASGAVGEEVLRVLEQRRTPVDELRLFASERSAGTTMAFAGADHPVRTASAEGFAGIDFAIFSAGAGVSRALAPAAVAAGAVVVDNSSAFRMDEGVPLVVPEVNPEALAAHRGLIANPNCSTILLCLALAPLQRAAGLSRVLVATYQAASGAGRRAVDELRASTARHLAGAAPLPPEALPHSLAFNLFARIDSFGADGYTREEDKLQRESRKILGLAALPVEATCVRVPVERCHAEAVTVELQRPLEPAAARALFAGAAGLTVEDDPERDLHPQPVAHSGRDAVAVGRVRGSRVFRPGLTFWLVGDQVRKGAALNAVQIVEALAR